MKVKTFEFEVVTTNRVTVTLPEPYAQEDFQKDWVEVPSASDET